jgi:hypothetical protein
MAALQPHPPSVNQVWGPLALNLIALAGTPDDAVGDPRLIAVAQLAADTVAAVSYASVTALRNDAYTTVAASSELAAAVDLAQYADESGPCLDALNGGVPVTVTDITATMAWPGFRETAFTMGLRASVSIPLFAGRGVPVAVLNLYGHDQAAMTSLITGVWAVYEAGRAPSPDERTPGPDAGAEELISGLAEAFVIRSAIQQGIGVIMADERCTSGDAYLRLRTRAAEAGISLTAAASALVAGNVPSDGRS